MKFFKMENSIYLPNTHFMCLQIAIFNISSGLKMFENLVVFVCICCVCVVGFLKELLIHLNKCFLCMLSDFIFGCFTFRF